MRRILLILLLAVLLLPAPHSDKPDVRPAASLPVVAQRVGPQGPVRVGALTLEGSWALKSGHRGFGGISSMRVEPEGRILALGDSGLLMGFHLGQSAEDRSFLAPLPIRAQDSKREWWAWDSESMTHDPVSDRYWVGFELLQRICRYAPGFTRVEACRVWPQVAAWPKTGSIESLARLPDGRFLAIGEMGMTPQGEHEALLFAGDPADEATAAPMTLRYLPPRGYRPTDAVAIDDRRLLVLNRRLSPAELFTGTIALVTLPDRPRPGALLKGQLLARIAPPLPSDNFEAIAVTREAGRLILWIMSDDNHAPFQRTLLLRFAMDDAVVNGAMRPNEPPS